MDEEVIAAVVVEVAPIDRDGFMLCGEFGSMAYAWSGSASDAVACFWGRHGTLLCTEQWAMCMAGVARKAGALENRLLGQNPDGRGVEGKVAEPFGDQTIDEWFSNPSKGKRKRLGYLGDLLGVDLPSEGHIRYQLVHRAAPAVIECKRFRGQAAAMVVHSFSQEEAWFKDFRAFVEVLGGLAEVGRMSEVDLPDGSTLLLGWARGNASYSTARCRSVQLPLWGAVAQESNDGSFFGVSSFFSLV